MTHPQVLSDEQIEAIRTEVFKRWQAMVDRGQIPGDDSCDHDLARAIESATLEALAKQEPFGYFKATPFGWTDCASTDEGAVALYERPKKSA
jgi:hypothetical protein